MTTGAVCVHCTCVCVYHPHIYYYNFTLVQLTGTSVLVMQDYNQVDDHGGLLLEISMVPFISSL